MSLPWERPLPAWIRPQMWGPWLKATENRSRIFTATLAVISRGGFLPTDQRFQRMESPLK